MTVYDFMEVFVEPNDQRVVLVDLRDGDVKEIFDDTYDNMSDEYQELELQSVDNIYDHPSCYGKVVINVDTSEMD